MCLPLALIPVAMAVASAAATAAGAYVQHQDSNKAAVAAQVAQNTNTESQYNVDLVNQRADAQQAFVQMTARNQQAAKQTALARVIAAQGGGSLSAQAINITGGEAADESQITANLAQQDSTLRDNMAALYTNDQSQAALTTAKFGANNDTFFSQVGSGVMSAASTGFGQYQTQVNAQNNASDYKLPSKGPGTQIFNGNTGIGDD